MIVGYRQIASIQFQPNPGTPDKRVAIRRVAGNHPVEQGLGFCRSSGILEQFRAAEIDCSQMGIELGGASVIRFRSVPLLMLPVQFSACEVKGRGIVVGGFDSLRHLHDLNEQFSMAARRLGCGGDEGEDENADASDSGRRFQGFYFLARFIGQFLSGNNVRWSANRPSVLNHRQMSAWPVCDGEPGSSLPHAAAQCL